MPQHDPAIGTNVPIRPYRPSKKKRRGPLFLALFLLLLSAILIMVRNEEIARSLPFIKKDAPPVAALHPVVEEMAGKLVADAEKAGITVRITQGLRSHDEQERLYEKGRSTEGAIVTYARGGESYHNYGLAVDFALEDRRGNVIWDMEYDGNRNGRADWYEVADLAKQLGFSWGGDWTSFKDYPHLQMDFGYSLSELRRGFRPPDDALPQAGSK